MINGKEVEFKVKDAIQAYVKQEEFNRNMDRRITHVSQREQRWTQDQNQFKQKVGDVIDTAQKGDFVSTIKALAKLAVGSSGLDVTKIERAYFDQLDKVREVYTKMTPEQQDAFFTKRALADATEKAKRLEEEKSAHVDKSQLQERVTQLQNKHGLSDGEFWGNYKYLVDNLVGPGKVFKSQDDISLDDAFNYSLRVRHESKVAEAGKKVGIEDDAILDEVSRISASDPTLTVDEIAKIIENSGIAKTAAPKAVENLNRKAGKSNTRFSQASSTKKENGKVEGYDKESLDFLYRKQPKVFQRPVR